jgi:hypothetical protein
MKEPEEIIRRLWLLKHPTLPKEMPATSLRSLQLNLENGKKRNVNGSWKLLLNLPSKSKTTDRD